MTLRRIWASLFALSLIAPLASRAQTPTPRLASTIGTSGRVALSGSLSPRIKAATDQGALSPEQRINGITLVFNRSAAQEADLQTLLAAQQNPASPLYHHWLTPDQFGARFGMAESDLANAQSWLQSQGFAINSVARSRDRITFSGNAGQVKEAFGAALHTFVVNGETHFAPAAELTLPAELAPTIAAVLHLSDFRPKPHLIRNTNVVRPDFTSSQTQAHYLTPLDVATQYNVNAVYNAGFNGAGQAIAVVGQTYIQTSDIQHFQTAAGLPSNLPNFVLVPNTGGSAIYAGDEAESDLDIEYTSGIARGAQIYLVYVGDSPNYGTFDSLAYAVSENIAPVISVSYGACETAFAPTDLNNLNSIFQQASTQGQTIVASSGDAGSTDCYGDNKLSTVQQQALAVDVPASSPYVTGLGGLQMASGTTTASNTTYFSAASGSDNIGSLQSYVPEVVWNEDSASSGISSGGGGSSAYFPRPTWQTGFPGIPAGTFRLVPDIALQASTGNPGYLYCSSDASTLADQKSTTSCSNGFRDSATGTLTAAGGTSFAAPIFAGLVAVLNQAKGNVPQGLINQELYTLAANSTTYASAFHDITSGTNACTAGATYCSTTGASAYASGAGYDEASGLGSINFANLVAAWPSAATATQQASLTTLSAATTAPASGSTDVITIKVAAESKTSTAGTPTGTVSIVVDGNTSAPTLITLANGQASYTYPGTTVGGSHVITAAYSGDANYVKSTSSISLTLAGTNIPSGSFTVAATSVTVPSNSTGTGTVTVTPASSYNGTVDFTLTSTTNVLCYALNPVGLPSATVATAQVIIGAGTACTSTAVRPGMKAMRQVTGTGVNAALGKTPQRPIHHWPAETALAGLLLTSCFVGRRSRRLPSLLVLTSFVVLGFGLSGCGGSSQPTTPIKTTGTYTVTLVGTDTITSSITSSTTFTVTVQ